MMDGPLLDGPLAWVLVAVGVYAMLRAYRVVVKVRSLLRGRVRPAEYRLVDDAPSYLARFVPYIERHLAPLGFTVVGLAHCRASIEERHSYAYLLAGDDGATFLLATPSAFRVFGLEVRLYTLFDGGASAEVTSQGNHMYLLEENPYLRVTTAFEPGWPELVAGHRARCEARARTGQVPMTIDAATLFSVLPELERRAFEEEERLGFMRSGSDGLKATTWRGVIKTYRPLTKAATQFPALSKLDRSDAPETPPELAAEAHLSSEAGTDRAEPRVFAISIFLVSAVGFALAWLGLFGGTFLPALLVVLLVHELGHWAAMRAFGYRNTRIFFIPFFGAAATGVSRDTKLWQEIVVLLAGPLPGLIFGGALLLLVQEGWVFELAAVFVALNGLNLLPFFPLDGGRVVHRLLHADAAWLDASIRVMAGLTFAAGAFFFEDYLLAFLAAIVWIGVPTSFRLARVARTLRTEGVERLSEHEQRVQVHAAVLSHPKMAKRPLVARFALARQLIERLRRPDEPLLSRLPFMVLYGALLSAPFAVFGVIALMGGLVMDRVSPPEVPLYVCADGADTEIETLTDGGEQVVAYRCEEMTPELSDAMDRYAGSLIGVCRPAPWEEAEGDAEEVDRAERTVAFLEERVERALFDHDRLPDESYFERRADAAQAALDAMPDEPGYDPEIGAMFVRGLRGEQGALAELGHRLGAGPSCLERRAYPLGVYDGGFQLLHEGDEVPPEVVLDYLCGAGCGSVGARTFGF